MENCTKFGQLILSKIIKIVATSCQISRQKCTKFDFAPLGELTALPQTPWLVGRGRAAHVAFRLCVNDHCCFIVHVLSENSLKYALLSNSA